MQNLTTTQKDHLYEGGHVGVTVTGETLDGDPISLTSDDIVEGSFTIERNWTSSGSTLEIGCADTSELTFELDNFEGQWSDLRWEGARLTVVLDIDGEPLQAGVFTVDEPPRKLTTMQIRALDDMARFNRPYEPGIVHPASLKQILIDCCQQCNVALETLDFTNGDYVVSQAPVGDGGGGGGNDDITFHHVVGWIAELAGCCAWIDELARLRLSWYGDQQQATPTLSFSRPSPAIHPETGEEIPEDTPVFVDFAEGKKGSLMVEGTENLLTENQSSFETDTSGWFGNNTDRTRINTVAWHGSWSLKCTPTGEGVSRGVYSAIRTPVTVGESYTAQCRAMQLSGGTVKLRLRLEWWDAPTGGTRISTSSYGESVTLDDTWQEIKVENKVAPEGATHVAICIYTENSVSASEEWVIDGIQLIQSSYPLPWHIGGSTRANPVKQITLPEALPEEFGVGVSFKPLWDSETYDLMDYRTIFMMGDAITSNMVRVMRYTNNQWDLRVYADGVGAYTRFERSFNAGEIIGFYIVKKGTRAKVFYAQENGESYESDWFSVGETFTNEKVKNIVIGSHYGGATRHAGGVIADFTLHDRPEDIDPMGYLSAIPGGGGE